MRCFNSTLAVISTPNRCLAMPFVVDVSLSLQLFFFAVLREVKSFKN